ncbi:MAG: glycogen debranching enzyme N-terminal domain-containing protein, partial [Verrucomicrobia bacterium]|nr:glycogen debranching enzyme N-terminal domain-containing protein [Verrucomicrobiota bacterium]
MNKPLMHPPPRERLLRFAGDTARFTLRGGAAEHAPSHGWQARLRTNLGRAALLRAEIIKARFHGVPFAGASWRDLPMHWQDGEWSLTLPLAEVGYFKAKAYAVTPDGFQVWPDGPDFGVSVHPDAYRTANTIYCAFPRMFGPNKTAASTIDEKLEARLNKLDEQGYTVIPPSGKLRDVVRELPHIFGTLGCRILHLLPVNPTPTTYARMGRFGSPYACGDLTAIDPALVEFDKRTTGIDQFCELTYAAHSLGGKVFLDLVINHTGWGAPLQENHPGWYLRDAAGNFVSPGAWGNIWADLVELEHKHPELWEHLAEVFLTWCRRGVDGFRCDAGYKVPMPAWQYITARVRQEFPDTVFLLEGLGGGWADTENLLTEGGMQWAYSELFQNYSGTEVANYLDYSLRQSERVGLYAHYSETHDNHRLAAKDRAWSLLRNRLCALTSASGGFGFTNGVEWLAAEKINVHSARGMSWGRDENIIPELAQLNHLLAEHPCFFDGAKLTRLSAADSPVFALRRDSAEGKDRVLVLVNNDPEKAQAISLDEEVFKELDKPQHDLLGQSAPHASRGTDGNVQFHLKPAACFCLAPTEIPRGLGGDAYRRARAQAAWGLAALAQRFDITTIDNFDWRELAEDVNRSPADFLARVQALAVSTPHKELFQALRSTKPAAAYPQVIVWNLADRRRVTPVPPNHWLLIEDTAPFRATLRCEGEKLARHAQSIAVEAGHIACFPPCADSADGELILERFAPADQRIAARVQFLAPSPGCQSFAALETNASSALEAPLALLTNGLGGMARVCVDLGSVKSKYDCVLAANLHASLPVDRHVLVKRVRVWCMADGFLTPLNGENLHSFDPGPPARWRFVANAGDGRAVEITLAMDMVPGENTVVLRFERSQAAPPSGCKLSDECEVHLTVRFDIEDRNFHWETKRNGGAEHHFANNCHPSPNKIGFEFAPAADRHLRVLADGGTYHHEGEWAENIPHPVEQSRGQTGSGDAYSPGWFDVPLKSGAGATIVASVGQASRLSPSFLHTSDETKENRRDACPTHDAFGAQLARSARAFVVRRGGGKTVIAGYPWFLDWGPDTLIAARGLLAAGMTEEVREILHTFARFEENGTLPNTIHGENASNRDTSDAPLWFGVVCEECAALQDP